MKQRRVGIIGTGWVGTSVAASVLQAGVADEVWLHDLREAVAEGEAMDLAHGAAFYPRCRVRAVPLHAMRDADVVIVAAGRNGRADESRLDLLADNAQVVAQIGQALAGMPGVVVLVTNPVDVLTRLMTELTGLPPARVIGTGTMLDTARLRQLLGETLDVSASSVHVQVMGEHGDSSVILWSSARVGGVALRRLPAWDDQLEQGLAYNVRTAAYNVIARKGATNHAIGWVTADLLRALLRDERRVLTVARVHTDVLGLAGVALSLPTVVGADGAEWVIEPQLDDAERAGLTQSAHALRQAYEALDRLSLKRKPANVGGK